MKKTALILWLFFSQSANALTLDANKCTWGFVNRVIDGDTIEVIHQSKKEKVRLIGVDTPETKHPKKGVEFFGKEAYSFTKKELSRKEVCLKADPSLKGKGRDRYNRILAFIFERNGKLFNAELVRLGFAKAYLKFPFSKMDSFKKLEDDAKFNKRGLWGSKP